MKKDKNKKTYIKKVTKFDIGRLCPINYDAGGLYNYYYDVDDAYKRPIKITIMNPAIQKEKERLRLDDLAEMVPVIEEPVIVPRVYREFKNQRGTYYLLPHKTAMAFAALYYKPSFDVAKATGQRSMRLK